MPDGIQYVMTLDSDTRLVRETVLPEDLEMLVSNVGVVPDFSAIYTSNSAPHTGFVQVSLKDTHRIGSYEYMLRVRNRLRADMPELTFRRAVSVILIVSGAALLVK